MPELERSLPVRDFFERFFNARKSLEACRNCANYGMLWSCPPFENNFNPLKFSRVSVVLRRVKNFKGAVETYREARREFDSRILELERAGGGRNGGALGFYAGSCEVCPPEKCVRPSGVECPFPERLRLSLEAAGFDVSKISEELFGVEIEWEADGRSPEFITLVGAVFLS